MNSSHDGLLLQLDISSINNWCAAISVKLSISEIRRHVPLGRPVVCMMRINFTKLPLLVPAPLNAMVFNLIRNYIPTTMCILLYPEYQVAGPVTSITTSSSSLHCLYVLHHSLVRPKLEYTSIVWNPVAFIDANTLESIQQKCISVSLRHFSPYYIL
jgi:hypothetical protein